MYQCPVFLPDTLNVFFGFDERTGRSMVLELYLCPISLLDTMSVFAQSRFHEIKYGNTVWIHITKFQIPSVYPTNYKSFLLVRTDHSTNHFQNIEVFFTLPINLKDILY